MTAPRLALLGALAATLTLAACSAPAPDPAVGGPTAIPSDSAPVSLSQLEFPVESTDWIATLADNKAAVLAWHDTFSADCTAELAGSADSAECTEGILTGLKTINGVKTSFDFSFDNTDWDNPDYTGLGALQGSRTTIQSASDSGKAFIDTCYYVPGQDGCAATAQTFLDDVDSAIAELGTWEQ